MKIGISTFVETTPNVETGEVISHAQRYIQDLFKILFLFGLPVEGLQHPLCEQVPLGYR